MKPLNIIPSFILILLCLTCVGQSKPHQLKIHIDSSNDVHYYQLVKHFLKSDNKDSLFEALRILNTLHYFDSSKYSSQILNSYYAKLESINYNYIRRNIKGYWVFEWAGSNWGTGSTFKTKNEKIFFGKRMAFFYHGDTLTRKTHYSITNKFSWPYVKQFVFQVYFDDEKSANDIFFKTSGADYDAHLKFSSKNIAMYLEAVGDCSDCGKTIYMKQSASDYRMAEL